MGNDCGEACQRSRYQYDELLRHLEQSRLLSHEEINEAMYHTRNSLIFPALAKSIEFFSAIGNMKLGAQLKPT